MFLIFYSFRFFWKSCLHILKDIDICFVIIIIEYCAPHFCGTVKEEIRGSRVSIVETC